MQTDTPRKTRLYNQIAKDYMPKQAEMMICKYIEALEVRLATLERQMEEWNNTFAVDYSNTVKTDKRKNVNKSTQEPESE